VVGVLGVVAGEQDPGRVIDLNGLGRVFAPDSTALLVGLVMVGLVAMAATLRRGVLPLRFGAGLLALVVVFAAGAASINVYFGYFTTWADVSAGLGNGPASTFVKTGKGKLTPKEIAQAVQKLPPSRTGSLLTVPLFGRRSHINRQGLVWLPPQYNDPAYAHTRFPVVELIPGTPGQPADWISSLHVTTLLAQLTASRHIGPMVVVMAAPNPPVGKGHGEECTNKGTRGAQDSTYMGTDVPADIAGAFTRVYPPGPHWAVAGYSSGGYCAVDLTLKHPGTYGAVVDLDGYLNPTEDGGLWHVIFNKNYAYMRTYDITAELALDHRQLPPFYLAAGTANAEDVDDLVTLKTLLKGRAAVTTFIDSGGHTFPVWRAELPAVFDWIWQHIGTGPTRGADKVLKTQVRPGR